MKHAISSVLFALPLALIACGGDDGGVSVIDGGDIDADNSGPDACVSKPSAPGKRVGRGGDLPSQDPVEHGACQAAATYGDATIGESGAAGTPEDVCVATSPVIEVFYEGALNADATPDLLSVQLYAGYGVFANGITTGTFTLTGEEAQFATCGACVRIFADVTQTEVGSFYMASSGSITLTSVDGNITGSLSGVTFTHVDIDPTTFMSTPNADACMSGVTSVSFDAAIQI